MPDDPAGHASSDMKPHEQRIFNRISVVCHAKSGLAEAGGPVKGQCRAVRRPHLEDNFKDACRAQMIHKGLEEHAAQAESLAPGGHGNRFQFRLRRQQAGHGKPLDALGRGPGADQGDAVGRRFGIQGGPVGRLWPLGRLRQTRGNIHNSRHVGRGHGPDLHVLCEGLHVRFEAATADLSSASAPKISASDRRR